MYRILSLIFKYAFIVIIYLFIFSIIRLIYLDIRSFEVTGSEKGAYLRLINLQEDLKYNLREYYPINRELTLGRDIKNKVVIKDPFISGKHFKIKLENNKYILEDLKSSNGTYVNDFKVGEDVEIFNGDRIKIGDIEFLFIDRT